MPGLFPVTVTSTTLSTDTNRTGFMGTFGWKTSEMKAVITALDAFHRGKNGGSWATLQDRLVSAFHIWRDKQPNEFRNRDRISGGLCTKLAIEIGFELRNENSQPFKSFLLVGTPRASPTARQIPTVILSPYPVHERMGVLNHSDRLGVILIDVQNRQVANLDQRWNGATTILENMCLVLDEANRLRIPIMEFWMAMRHDADLAKQGTIADLAGKLRERPNVTTEQKPTHNAFEATGLAAWIAGNQLDVCVVMGFNANQCVGATIFGGLGRPIAGVGQPYIPGLLDRGVNVLSSRGILASGGEELKASEGWPYIGTVTKT
jgi:nicotinamidase-related amidase